jgi:hypothetical protein
MAKQLLVVAILLLLAGQSLTHAESAFVARIGQSGEFLEIIDQSSRQVVRDDLPLYRSANIRYFSAGVGMEERRAEYPLFSLKLVFTAGGKPYLTGVEVTVSWKKAEGAIMVPREQVEGPWLFIDLPSGRYDISAMYGNEKQESKDVRVAEGHQTTVYLRWKEDVGPMRPLPTD